MLLSFFLSVALFCIVKSIIFPICMVFYKYYIIAPRNKHVGIIQKSGEWAVVTGATDGIGREYARQLAKIGMKVFLIGRSEEKLQNTAKELKLYYKTEARYYKADFCSVSIYDGLREELESLDIGVLVNNVGMSQPFPCRFNELNVEHSFIADLLNCNIISAVSMTKIVLPKMTLNKRGIIINISSASSLGPLPLSALYSSSKSFLTHFSRTIAFELKDTGVMVQTVRPFFVQTKFIGKFRPPRLLTPTAEEFVASAIRMLGIESETFGTPSHSIQGLLVCSVPSAVHLLVANIISNTRAHSLHKD